MRWIHRYRIMTVLRSAHWLLWLASVLLALVLTPLLRRIDHAMQWTVMAFGLDGARALLSTLAGSMLSVLVFMLGMLLIAVQLSSTQLTPRLIAITIMRSGPAKYTIALVVFTFLLSIGGARLRCVHQAGQAAHYRAGQSKCVGSLDPGLPGLPGHQAAVAVCFEQFVRPVLTRFTGAVLDPALEGITTYRTVKARLGRSIASSPGREDHVRVTLEKRDDVLYALPVFGASGLISTLVKAVGTVAVPVNSIGIEAGEEVEVRLF